MHYNGTIINFIVYSVPELIGNHLPLVNFVNWKGDNLKIKIGRGLKLSKIKN